jgi:type VI secretion system protein ImpC
VVTLLSRIDTTGKVRVYLVHLPKSELERDLSDADDPLRSKLSGLLAEPDLGVAGRRWAFVVGAYDFNYTPEDIRLLEKAAFVAQAANVPWFSSIRLEPAVRSTRGGRDLGATLEQLPKEWTRFRARPEAAWMGLTHPRFLVREPYGGSPRHSRVFDFKENVETATDLLWGDGAFLCAALMAQGFAESEWSFRLGSHLDVGGMPLAPAVGGSGETLTSVETKLSLSAAKDLTEMGLIPLLSFPERAGIRLGGLHSIAASGAPIQAWWKS